jgi:hypothetical protein
VSYWNARKRARGRGESCLLETRLLHKEAIKETLTMVNGHGAGAFLPIKTGIGARAHDG